jgi:succinoglycan biosynthesis transport protein ExoP
MNPSQELLLSSSAIRTINVPPPEKELTIKDLLTLLTRRRGLVLGVLIFFVGVAGLYCIFSTRRYEATAEIQVQRAPSSPLGLDNAAGEETSDSSAIEDNVTLQTQASILGSDSLALKVIRDLNLASTKDFQSTFNPISWFLGLISPTGPSDAQLGPSGDADLGMSPRERIHVLAIFGKNLKVKPVAGTRLIDISYLSSDPRMAAEVVNHLTQGLSDYNYQTRHNATAKTADYLTTQLSDLRKQSEALQADVARAQRESGVLSLGGVDAQGREQVYSSVLDKLQQATTAYTQAESNRIAQDAVYEAAKTGDPEAISSLSGGTAFSNRSGDNGLALIQGLRLQQATLKSQLAELSAKFGPAYPKLAELRQQLDTLNGSIKTEVARMAERAKNDAYTARVVEQSTRKVYNDLKAQADAMNDKTITYTIMRQEADQSRTLYETLFRQLKEAGVLADFKVSNISIVDPARVPARPAKPNVLLYLAASILGGLFFGSCAAFLRDLLDSKIRSLPDLEAQLGHLPLGVLPYHDQQRSLRKPVRAHIHSTTSQSRSLASAPRAELVTSEHLRVAALSDPRSAYVEALRALRTSILLSRGGAPPKVILITSSIAAEGKSMLSINLATVLAQQGKRVLLVDGDFRRPTLHRTLNIANTEGLSSFLAGHSSTSDPLTIGLSSQEVPGLTVLPAGPVPPYPTELLGSDQMRLALKAWREHFDFVLIDGAPVLPVTDSVVLSAMVDFSLLIARYEMTERQSLDQSYRLLQSQTERSKIGVVLNAVNRDSSTYYQYYGYKDSVYYGSNKKYA